MQLVIAEKPSVARDLARVLGLRASGRNAIEGPGRVITWCIGHLVELEEPVAYDPRWKSWRMDTLPMIPSAFKLRAVAGTRDQLRVVRELLRDRRFTEVVNACDAGREGELIFRYVYELAGSRLPVRRLWISSLTDEAIRQGFATLKPGRDYDPLGDAARCRSEADWLVGMNATRAVTLRFRATDGERPLAVVEAPVVSSRGTKEAAGQTAGKWGRRGQQKQANAGWRASMPPIYSIGRVQTPTLAILVRREQAIRAFVPNDYWEIRGTFAPQAAGSQTFTAMWSLKRESDRTAITRFGGRAIADAVLARVGAHAGAADPGGPVVETLVQKKTREPAPLLFDLTSLQRTANRRYGLSASRTLEVAQALYERHKVLTYPRTDSRHLPQDMLGELPKLFRGLAKIPAYEAFAEPLIDAATGDDAAARARTSSRRIFDGAKVHDHHAIIPTGKVPGQGGLDRDEQRIFDLVARRFLGAFHPDAEFALTEAVIRVGDRVAAGTRAVAAPSTPSESSPAGEEVLLAAVPPPPDRFVARGRVRLVAGWQDVAGLDERRGGARASGDAGGADGDSSGAKDKDVEATLPPLAEGQRLAGRFETLARQTRPPPRHTEATLLGAMESAGREIEDEALRAAMKETGLGTPATRAATIETLAKRGFISREGKQVIPTPTGIALIERLPVPTLASPELTGAWEARLVRIARGQDTRAAFMIDIARYVREVTDAVRSVGPARRPAESDRKPAPTTVATRETKTKPAAAVALAAGTPALRCPRCGKGSLISGKRGWGCSDWRAGCAFVIWFEVAGKRITETQLQDLIGKGKTRKAKWPQPNAPASAGHLVLDLNATRQEGAARFQPA